PSKTALPSIVNEPVQTNRPAPLAGDRTPSPSMKVIAGLEVVPKSVGGVAAVKYLPVFMATFRIPITIDLAASALCSQIGKLSISICWIPAGFPTAWLEGTPKLSKLL